MRKRFRVVQTKFGYRAEYNTRWMIDGEGIRENWPDNWLPIGVDRETLEEAKVDIQDWKNSIDTVVIYEE